MPTPPTYTNAFAIIGTIGRPLDFDLAYTWGQNRTPLICYGAAYDAPNYNSFAHSFNYVTLPLAGIPYIGLNLYNGKPGGGSCTIYIDSFTGDNFFLFGSADKDNYPPTYVYDLAGIDMDQVDASLVGATVTTTAGSYTVTSEAINFNGVAQSIGGTIGDDILSITPL